MNTSQNQNHRAQHCPVLVFIEEKFSIMSDDFHGKLAIITGASKLNGIGFATAHALAKRGADVRPLFRYDNRI